MAIYSVIGNILFRLIQSTRNALLLKNKNSKLSCQYQSSMHMSIHKYKLMAFEKQVRLAKNHLWFGF